LDRDGNGFIDEKELAEIIGLRDKFDSKMMKKLIADADDNNDNKIDFDEFRRMVTTISNPTKNIN